MLVLATCDRSLQSPANTAASARVASLSCACAARPAYSAGRLRKPASPL